MQKSIWAFLVSLTMISSLSASAEYRAFELRIDNTEKGSSRTVVSVLDHLQYPHFYPLNNNEVAIYADSWMCYENMSYFRRTCPKPDRKPSSATTP